ncbi:MAG: DUF3369 domain-containing protein [Gammaproteobacteria bacterium]|nr:MAG: DUF3369 domain-containing protein [Gammaproteobacteria bacterium]
MNNQLLFAPEDQDFEEQDTNPIDAWKIAIVDDDILVHQVTKMVLEDFTFENRPVQFLGAFSQKEGYKLFEEHSDIAVCILDVIMETDDAGIKLAHDIREKLNNDTTRIVLRTGQPGLGIEEEIISKYCINDYKTKTELTSAKLRTVITSCIRTYVELNTLKNTKSGILKCMDICGSILSDPQYASNINEYSNVVLESLSEVLNSIDKNLAANINGLIAIVDKNSADQILASKSEHGSSGNYSLTEILPEAVQSFIENNSQPFAAEVINGDLIASMNKDDDVKCIAFLKWIPQIAHTEQETVSSYLHTMIKALVKRFL